MNKVFKSNSVQSQNNLLVVLATLFIAFFIISCGPARQLQKTYVGKPVAELQKVFGYPVTVLDRENGQVYVFEKTEKLESTKIDQGQLSLDPIVTPQVIKTRRYYFNVSEGKVTDLKVEDEYER